MCATMVERMMAYRDALPKEEEARRFVDVRMDRLTADPIGTVRDIYARFGLPFTPEYEAALHTYIAAEESKKHGEHAPRATRSSHQEALAALGINDAEMTAKFGRYCARYLA
jgi:hypothetical protein